MTPFLFVGAQAKRILSPSPTHKTHKKKTIAADAASTYTKMKLAVAEQHVTIPLPKLEVKFDGIAQQNGDQFQSSRRSHL